MIHIQELGNYLSTLLEQDSFDDKCFNGIQIEGSRPISTIMSTTSCTLEAIENAHASGADALLVHHGLFWKGEFSSLRGNLKKKVHALLDHGIHLLAYHLPVDAHKEFGNNWPVAKELGWQNLTPFCLYGRQFIGVHGSFPTVETSEFVKNLENYWGRPAVFVDSGKKEISSCAFISGRGFAAFQQAIDEGVDCFMTGSFDEGVWHLAKEEGVHFIAFGHNTTEKKGVRLLGDHLASTFSIRHIALDDKNPF